MDMLKIILLGSIGALIGWVTNKVAIKLLFRPLYPINIPLFNFEIHGLIPKRKNEIAKAIGETVEVELLSLDDLLDKFRKDMDIESIKNTLRIKIKAVIKEKLPSIIPTTFKNMILTYIDDFIDSNGEDFINELTDDLISKTKDNISISSLVEEKINSYDMLKIENIVLSIADKELKHIEILGGVLGLIIGLVQGVLVILI